MIRATACWLLLASIFLARGETLPDAKEVLRRLQERAEKVVADTNRYHYTRTNLMEHIDGDGKVVERKEKTYLVALKQGLPRARLIVENGRALPESEQKMKTSEERRLQKAIAQEKNPDYSKPKPWINEDLLNRFVFVVTGRTNVEGRSVLMMKFDPVPDAPAPKMVDKVINRIAGVLWVDEEESEIARLELRMGQSIKFWGGFLGKLERFDFLIVRQRSPLGVWYNQLSKGMIHMRTLFTTARMRIHEEAFGFGVGEP